MINYEVNDALNETSDGGNIMIRGLFVNDISPWSASHNKL